MNQKKLILLCVAFAAVFGLYLAGQSSMNSSKSVKAKELFGDINPQKIYRIKIEQGEKGVELELRGDTWTVPSKSNFPADESKVRSLLVKLLDLSVSQEVTNNPARFDDLGVGEDIKKSGKSRVGFFDNTGGPITGVLIGEQRKRAKDADYMSSIGQYIRRTDQNTVYLVPQTLSFESSVSSWLNLDIVNVLQSRIIGIAQYVQDGGADKLQFELEEVADSTANPREFAVKGDKPAGQIVDSSAVAQVRAGLENARVLDVFPASDPVVQGLNFDKRTVFKINNGLEYQVATAEKDGKTYGKVTVTFNAVTARVLTEAAEKKAAEKKAAEASSSSAAPESSPTPVPTPTPSASGAAAPAADPVATQDEATKLSAQFAGWVYEIPSFNAKKFRTTREQLFKKPDDTPVGAPKGGMPSVAPAGPGGSAQSMEGLSNMLKGMKAGGNGGAE